MNVKKLLDILRKEVKPVDRENANIEIWCGSQEFEIESMKGFAICPDIAIHLKKTESSLLQPFRFKAERTSMVNKKLKEITKKRK